MKVHIFLILNTVTTVFAHGTASIIQWPQIVCEVEIIDYTNSLLKPSQHNYIKVSALYTITQQDA
jgi:hypothetical protein